MIKQKLLNNTALLKSVEIKALAAFIVFTRDSIVPFAKVNTDNDPQWTVAGCSNVCLYVWLGDGNVSGHAQLLCANKNILEKSICMKCIMLLR